MNLLAALALLATQAADYGPGVRKFLERGKPTGAVDYVRAQRAKTQLGRDMEAAFANVDALLTPGELVPPPLHEARTATIDGREVGLGRGHRRSAHGGSLDRSPPGRLRRQARAKEAVTR